MDQFTGVDNTGSEFPDETRNIVANLRYRQGADRPWLANKKRIFRNLKHFYRSLQAEVRLRNYAQPNDSVGTHSGLVLGLILINRQFRNKKSPPPRLSDSFIRHWCKLDLQNLGTFSLRVGMQ